MNIGNMTAASVPMNNMAESMPMGPDGGILYRLPQDHELPLSHECSIISSQTRPSGGQTSLSRRFDPGLHYSTQQTMETMQIRKNQFVFLACPTTPPCMDCGHLVPHTECPVISVHGACSNDGTKEARCAIGIWIGENNPSNLFVPLDGLPRHTAQVAELCAVTSALCHVGSSLEKWKRVRSRPFVPSELHTIVIKTDSPYIVNGITEWLAKWKSNGWKKGNGQPISNADCWKTIDFQLELLEKDICVQFWLVSPGENEMAVTLAKDALKRPEDSKVTQKMMARWAATMK